MPSIPPLSQELHAGRADALLSRLYGGKADKLARQRQRYINLLSKYQSIFPETREVEFFSTPGRTEVGGNHTDHNSGRVLAAAVDLDAVAVVSKNDEGIITVQSEGYPLDIISINELLSVPAEKYTSAALIRGVCNRFEQLGYRIGGFNAYINSDVLKGSGLSSSAAYEVLIGTILNFLYNGGKINPITVAQVGRYAENHYFGKPCGLMDQITAAVGGFVTIDFKDSLTPLVKRVNFDFSNSRYTLVIVDTGGNHADLNEDYASVEQEMKSVAQALGGTVLREFSKKKVLENIPALRDKVSDRAILRALHFYDDDQRVVEEVKALEDNDFQRFLSLVILSGRSSWMLNQNCYSTRNVGEQGVSVALAVSENILKGRGAWRVHGGGFAGTIQAFVPDDLLEGYLRELRSIYGDQSCYELMIRQMGTTMIPFEI